MYLKHVVVSFRFCPIVGCISQSRHGRRRGAVGDDDDGSGAAAQRESERARARAGSNERKNKKKRGGEELSVYEY